jgi:hypothetical protein
LEETAKISWSCSSVVFKLLFGFLIQRLLSRKDGQELTPCPASVTNVLQNPLIYEDKTVQDLMSDLVEHM